MKRSYPNFSSEQFFAWAKRFELNCKTPNLKLSTGYRSVLRALLALSLIHICPNCLVAPDNEYIRTHTRRPAASSGNAPARKSNGTGAKPRKPVSRKSTVVNRGGVLTNDTRSSRKGRYR